MKIIGDSLVKYGFNVSIPLGSTLSVVSNEEGNSAQFTDNNRLDIFLYHMGKRGLKNYIDYGRLGSEKTSLIDYL